MVGGIYKLTSPNGKSYIGQSMHLKRRIGEYRRLECKGQTKIYKAIKKYGFENFKIDYLFETNKNYKYINILLDSLEIKLIKKYDTIENGYNLQLGGSFGKHSNETKLKLSENRIGKKLSEETKIKIGDASRGKKISDKQKQMMSEFFMGKPLSEDHKNKLKISRQNRITTEETKIKMSKAQTGRKHSDETIIKMKESAKNRKNERKFNSNM